MDFFAALSNFSLLSLEFYDNSVNFFNKERSDTLYYQERLVSDGKTWVKDMTLNNAWECKPVTGGS